MFVSKAVLGGRNIILSLKNQLIPKGTIGQLILIRYHTRVDPVGGVTNYDMGMKIHAICDAKNAILKYFSLDMWKFAQI